MGQGTLTFMDQDKVWKCDKCEYRHPDQNALSRHLKAAHQHAHWVFIGMPPYIFIHPDKIEITDEPW